MPPKQIKIDGECLERYLKDLNLGTKITSGIKIGGSRAAGGFRIDHDKFLKIYTGERVTIVHTMEADILMRLRNPGIPKGYDIINGENLRQLCGENNVSYGILMDYVQCDKRKDDLVSILKYLISMLSVELTLLVNNYKHTDYAAGNQCSSEGIYKIIDFNGDSSTSYLLTRLIGEDHEGENIGKSCVLILLDIQERQLLQTGIQNLPMYNKSSYSEMENILIDDLILRTHHPDENVILDIYEIPLHPIFKLHQIKFEYPDEVDTIVYPLTHNFDYIKPIEENIHDLMISTKFFEAIDIYYRYLPFIKEESQLSDLLRECFYLTATSQLKGKFFENYFGGNHILEFDIYNKLKSILRTNFYHLAATGEDDELCWLLMFGSDYNTYMNICGNNIYKLNRPTTTPRINNKNLYEKYGLRPQINKDLLKIMTEPYNVQEFCFSKLTKDEMFEFMNANNFDYKKSKRLKIENPMRFYIGDMCQRIYVYGKYNNNIIYTQAVTDLITQSQWDYSFHIYTNEEIDNLNENQLLELAFDMHIHPITTFLTLKESVKRILRMSYLLSLR
jgi:hypothetical protein